MRRGDEPGALALGQGQGGWAWVGLGPFGRSSGSLVTSAHESEQRGGTGGFNPPGLKQQHSVHPFLEAGADVTRRWGKSEGAASKFLPVPWNKALNSSRVRGLFFRSSSAPALGLPR